MEKNDLSFYLDNQDKINNIIEYRNNVNAHFLKEIETAFITFDDKMDLSGKRFDRLRFFTSKRNPNLMITVIVEGLMKSERGIYIAVELHKNLLKDKTRYKELFENEDQKLGCLNEDFYTNTNMHWAHLAGSPFFLIDDEIANLSETIVKKIRDEGFLQIFSQLDNFLLAENKEQELGVN